MDVTKKILEKIKPGHATTLYGLVILRIADRYVYGESINIRAKGEQIDEAVRGIYELCRNR